jgi:hypothetical protein
LALYQPYSAKIVSEKASQQSFMHKTQEQKKEILVKLSKNDLILSLDLENPTPQYAVYRINALEDSVIFLSKSNIKVTQENTNSFDTILAEEFPDASFTALPISIDRQKFYLNTMSLNANAETGIITCLDR